MGSRAVVVVCRDHEAALRRFGVTQDEIGVCYTRTGRRFFTEGGLNVTFLARIHAAVTRAGLWDELETGWVCLDLRTDAMVFESAGASRPSIRSNRCLRACGAARDCSSVAHCGWSEFQNWSPSLSCIRAAPDGRQLRGRLPSLLLAGALAIGFEARTLSPACHGRARALG